MVPSPLPPWPLTPPRHGRVTLREVRESDVAMALDLAADPYVPQTGTLPAAPSPEDALAWVHRQRGRHAEGSGFSFTVVERRTGLAVGHCGLWLRAFPHGSAGYAIAPSFRGRGLATDALRALTRFGWTVPRLERVELAIEPWNAASLRTAERAGYRPAGSTTREIGGALRTVARYVALRPEGPPAPTL